VIVPYFSGLVRKKWSSWCFSQSNQNSEIQVKLKLWFITSALWYFLPKDQDKYCVFPIAAVSPRIFFGKNFG